MHLLIIGVWVVVSSIVGVRSARDIKQERADHKVVQELREQERELKARRQK